ncbi:two-component sensor histidine kinase [Chitinophaga pendula]|uniref:sensor histidine kinase n=1 Tax=Chitinophaga TaxID=79328 RepID=UPI000BAF62CC|nr:MULTISPECIES: ATP-binding protein [Chitinophaga]ASZ10295.1 two-component sensor histidine kinase [Chitinophaga sp. MD30]UCJ06743.1 two-component sensor histidine kinase [Chitinophaga pendula]
MIRKLFHRMQDGKVVSTIYFIVLAYTILALVWWGILLFMQSEQISRFEKQNLELRTDKKSRPLAYQLELKRISRDEEMRSFKFFGEGATFLGIILLGAFFVYRAVWKHMKLTRQQQNFMMAVTHELKSPIAAAKLNLETLRKHKLDEDRQQKLLENTIRETNRLDQLVNNILLAAQFETQQYHLFLEDVDYTTLLQSGIKELQSRLQYHIITTDIQPGVWLRGDRLMLQIVLSNLVENAAKYSPRHTGITVTLKQMGKQLKLQVSDEGPGIPEEEKERIFLKFYRIGNENTRKSKGSGLGLFLTQKIVQQHGGVITVKDAGPSGACFEIVWPVYSIQTA